MDHPASKNCIGSTAAPGTQHGAASVPGTQLAAAQLHSQAAPMCTISKIPCKPPATPACLSNAPQSAAPATVLPRGVQPGQSQLQLPAATQVNMQQRAIQAGSNIHDGTTQHLNSAGQAPPRAASQAGRLTPMSPFSSLASCSPAQSKATANDQPPPGAHSMARTEPHQLLASVQTAQEQAGSNHRPQASPCTGAAGAAALKAGSCGTMSSEEVFNNDIWSAVGQSLSQRHASGCSQQPAAASPEAMHSPFMGQSLLESDSSDEEVGSDIELSEQEVAAACKAIEQVLMLSVDASGASTSAA